MFSQGQIVKSNKRSVGHELFLLVIFDPEPSPTQFNAVVLKDYSASQEFKSGERANNWNTSAFNLSNWGEFKNSL